MQGGVYYVRNKRKKIRSRGVRGDLKREGKVAATVDRVRLLKKKNELCEASGEKRKGKGNDYFLSFEGRRRLPPGQTQPFHQSWEKKPLGG